MWGLISSWFVQGQWMLLESHEIHQWHQWGSCDIIPPAGLCTFSLHTPQTELPNAPRGLDLWASSYAYLSFLPTDVVGVLYLGVHPCDASRSTVPSSSAFQIFPCFQSVHYCLWWVAFPDLAPGPVLTYSTQISWIFLDGATLWLFSMNVYSRLDSRDIWHTATGQGSTSLALSSAPLSSPLFHMFPSPLFHLGHCCCLSFRVCWPLGRGWATRTASIPLNPKSSHLNFFMIHRMGHHPADFTIYTSPCKQPWVHSPLLMNI